MSTIRILVVDDEVLVALHIEEMLEDLGFEVVGPAVRLDDARQIAGTVQIDAAVLDIDVNGQLSFPLADELEAKGIPFIFASGHGPDGLNDAHKQRVALRKPFVKQDLQMAFQKIGLID